MPIRAVVGLVGCLLLTLAIAACDDDLLDDGLVRGSGNLISETRDVSGFDEIHVSGSGDVIIEVTGTESLEIEAEDNIMPLLTTVVRNGRLELGLSGSFSTSRRITYTITAAALNGIEISGSADVTATGVDADVFDVRISGSGDVVVVGSSEVLDVAVSGSGGFSGEELTAARGSVEVSGSGSAVVNVSDELDATVSGSGRVDYLGDPSVTQDVSGSGDVSRR